MGRTSSINAMPPPVRELFAKLVREGRGIDQITEHLAQLLNEPPSRSAVGRAVKSAREQMRRYREAQEVARVWVGRLEEEPDGDVGRLLSEMLRTVAFQQLAGLGDEGAAVEPRHIAALAGAIRDLAAADKTRADTVLRLRKEVARDIGERVSAAANTAPGHALTPEQVNAIIREAYGV